MPLAAPSNRAHPIRILAAGVVLSAAACSAPAAESEAAGTVIKVESSATECRIEPAEAPSGTLTFRVTNTGEDVTEFYLLAEDGAGVVAEVENIGPGLTRDLEVEAEPGRYLTACKPGMAGDGIRAPFTVTSPG